MITISLCMIVKNEEVVLENCLNSIHDLVDEIIIVDTGSTDKTKEITAKFTDKTYDFEWIDDFSAARNFSYSKATKDYILWMDADDVLLEEDRKKFKELKDTLDESVDSVTMIYNYAFDKNGNVRLSFKRNRLVKRSNNFKWEGVAHNLLVVRGKIIDSDICIAHKRVKPYTDRTLKIFRKKLQRGEEFTKRDIFYYANELYDNKFYYEALEYYKKYFSFDDVWFENKIHACGKISDYYRSIGNYTNALRYCFKSFEYCIPRAEFCCRLGYIFKEENKLKEAIFWYELATTLKKPEENGGFFNDECWTWLPYLQLCICYDKLGNHDLAYKYNEIARNYVPNNEFVLHNKKYFESLGYK